MHIFTWFLNALVTFLIAFLLIRLVGKRTVAKMSETDLFVIAVSSSLLADGLRDSHKYLQVGVTAGFFYLIYFGYTLLMLNNKFRQLIHNKTTVLISQGNINETGLRKVRMSTSELLSELRIKGYTSLSDVEFAFLEQEGEVSVLPKSHNAPVTLQDLHLHRPPATLPVPVVLSGEVIDDNLRLLERDHQWLADQLAKQGLAADQIPLLSLVQVETNGTITIDRNEAALLGKSRDENKIGQYASQKQGETAVMPPYHNNPGVAEGTKKALEQREQQRPAPPSTQKSPSPPPNQLQQLQDILFQMQQQQAMHQQLLEQVQQLLQTTHSPFSDEQKP